VGATGINQQTNQPTNHQPPTTNHQPNGCFVIYIPSSDKGTIFHNYAEQMVV
jgi:hypothetical protein